MKSQPSARSPPTPGMQGHSQSALYRRGQRVAGCGGHQMHGHRPQVSRRTRECHDHAAGFVYHRPGLHSLPQLSDLTAPQLILIPQFTVDRPRPAVMALRVLHRCSRSPALIRHADSSVRTLRAAGTAFRMRPRARTRRLVTARGCAVISMMRSCKNPQRFGPSRWTTACRGPSPYASTAPESPSPPRRSPARTPPGPQPHPNAES